MTIECYDSACPRHSYHELDDGPFCFEAVCIKPIVWAQPTKRSVEDWAHEEAHIYACELVGPNSLEYEDVFEARYEELLSSI